MTWCLELNAYVIEVRQQSLSDNTISVVIIPQTQCCANAILGDSNKNLCLYFNFLHCMQYQETEIKCIATAAAIMKCKGYFSLRPNIIFIDAWKFETYSLKFEAIK